MEPPIVSSRRLRERMTAFGYVHRQDLVDAGWSGESIRAAVRAGQFIVARRHWILAPESGPILVRAARAGGRVTCRSATRLLGLWDPGQTDVGHIAVGAHSSSCFESGIVVHRAKPIAPVPPRDLVDPIENVLATVATCFPYEQARSIWDSALRARKATLEHLRAVPGWPPQARRLLTEATALSHSGLETRVVTRLARVGVAMVQQALIAGHRVDGLIGERLVIQIDGYEFHQDARQRRSDIAHDVELRLLGYTVLRFDYFQVVHCWPQVEAQILAAIAQGLHLATR
jgi:very-short-patch-repair endonuclease